MIPPFLSRWLGKTEPAPANPGRELARIRHANDRALIRKTARDMREAMGLPASPALADRP